MKTGQFQHITLQQLEALVHLVEERNFSRAANRMNISQPSLSKHIRNLENFAGGSLLERGPQGISLTEEGRIIHDYACRMLDLRSETAAAVTRCRDNTCGSLNIGASTIPATYILPQVISAMQQQFPGIFISLATGPSAAIIEQVLAGTADLGIVGRSVSDRRLICEELWQDRLVVAIRKGHPWDDGRRLNLADLGTRPYIGRCKGSATRAVMEEHFRDGVRLNPVCELASSEAVKEAVLAGTGFAVISEHAVRREIDYGLISVAEIQGLPLTRSICLIYRKQLRRIFKAAPTGTTATFRNICRQHAV